MDRYRLGDKPQAALSQFSLNCPLIADNELKVQHNQTGGCDILNNCNGMLAKNK